MSRVLKFRAYDKTNKRMMKFGKYWSCDEYQSLSWEIDEDSKLESEGDYSLDWNRNNLEIMQYTGLKDKNGVEIYEGDIVAGDPPYFISRVLGVVRYNGMSFCFEGTTENTQYVLSGGKDDTYWRYHVTNPSIKQLDEIEVIGNIYSNPDLIASPADERTRQ